MIKIEEEMKYKGFKLVKDLIFYEGRIDFCLYQKSKSVRMESWWMESDSWLNWKIDLTCIML